MDFVVKMYANLLKLLGDEWDKVPTFIQELIVPTPCSGSKSVTMARTRALVKDENLLEHLYEMVEQAFDEI